MISANINAYCHKHASVSISVKEGVNICYMRPQSSHFNSKGSVKNKHYQRATTLEHQQACQ